MEGGATDVVDEMLTRSEPTLAVMSRQISWKSLGEVSEVAAKTESGYLRIAR
jgi:hypothetical protein